ncbi:MAG TPA: sec-independent translocase [Propionibacteriaceae bacterium]
MVPLLLDINAPEFMLLLVIAVVLFGPEKLPDLARKAARVVKYVRTIAGTAQDQLSKELGPGFENLDFRDLNPRAFVQKHLLEDVEPIMADVKRELTDVGSTVRGGADDVAGAIDGVKNVSSGGPHNVMAALTPVRAPFDAEAT